MRLPKTITEDFDWGKIDPPPKRRRKRGRPEAKVQQAILSILVMRLHALCAITDAGALSKMGLGMACGIPKGWPDITCCLMGGRFLGVECKAPGGRQSLEQQRCQSEIEQRGGLYVLASSPEEFEIKITRLLT
jgi:hypothetical protein